ENHHRQLFRAILAAGPIAEHELGAGVLEDEVDGRIWKPVVNRYRDETCAHDAEIGGDVFGAVGRQNGDAIPTLETAFGQRAGDPNRHGVEFEKRVLGRHLFAAEVDDCDLGEVAVAPDQIA